jgi:hypothetical protein
MKPQVIIVSKKNDPSLNSLLYTLKQHSIKDYKIIHSKTQLDEIDKGNLKGFFIFCIPPSEMQEWLYKLDDKFLDYFKIYNYNYLIEGKIDTSLFLNFDFIIAGDQENGILHRQLEFLKSNYWRKVPISKFGLKRMPESNIISRLFKILETSDINISSIDQVSKKLNVSKEVLRKEIRKNLRIHYTDLTSILLNYYREVYPD